MGRFLFQNTFLMKINGTPMRSIRVQPGNDQIIEVIEQRQLPWQFELEPLSNPEDAERAIKEMHVRGAPLIGITAAYGMYLAALQSPDGLEFQPFMEKWAIRMRASRPTAVNLMWAVDHQTEVFRQHEREAAIEQLFIEAGKLADEDAEMCRMIGVHGLPIIEELSRKKGGKTVNILTHCNAGWLACVDWGTATSPIYQAFDKGIDVHVWVDETRPRNQGARLTAFELSQHGVPHTVIPDNAGGHLMQHGMVDMVITGTDRTTRTGDVANKIGTYLKALAAKANDIPFYVALPSSTFDFSISDGVREIPIETRSSREVTHIEGWDGEQIREVLLTPAVSPAVNYGFDVTPAEYVTGLITERGVCPATEKGIIGLFPEQA